MRIARYVDPLMTTLDMPALRPRKKSARLAILRLQEVKRNG